MRRGQLDQPADDLGLVRHLDPKLAHRLLHDFVDALVVQPAQRDLLAKIEER